MSEWRLWITPHLLVSTLVFTALFGDDKDAIRDAQYHTYPFWWFAAWAGCTATLALRELLVCTPGGLWSGIPVLIIGPVLWIWGIMGATMGDLTALWHHQRHLAYLAIYFLAAAPEMVVSWACRCRCCWKTQSYETMA